MSLGLLQFSHLQHIPVNACQYIFSAWYALVWPCVFVSQSREPVPIFKVFTQFDALEMVGSVEDYFYASLCS